MELQYKVIEPDSELNKVLCDFTSMLRKGYVEIGEEKTLMPIRYLQIANDIENLEIRESDIFVMTHPKAGTTWCQEMVWMICNLDYERAKIPLSFRFPFLEFQCVLEGDNEEFVDKFPEYKFPPTFLKTVNHVKNLKDNPRFIKTHLPWSLMPREIREKQKNAKVIYVARNPKDVCVSYFYHSRVEGYNGTFENFCKLFLADKVMYGPFWKGVLPMWERRHESNILFIHYEDMKKDLKAVIKKVAAFLGKDLSEDDITKLEDHLSFESMKKNPSVNNEFGGMMLSKIFQNGTEDVRFMRSGTVGSYKAVMTSEMIKKIDEWTLENTKGTGYFDFLYGSR